MSVAQRIKYLLTENECNGAFNAYDELSFFTYHPQDFDEIRGWTSNGIDIEIVISDNAMMLFEDSFLKGISLRQDSIAGSKDTSAFKTVRGKDSDFTGALLDGFL